MPDGSRTRWSDDRLDDFTRRTDYRLASLEEAVARLGRLEVSLAGVVEDSRECNQNVKQLRDDIDTRRKEERQERKTDRRWTIGTILTSAGLVIAAVSLLADKL